MYIYICIYVYIYIYIIVYIIYIYIISLKIYFLIWLIVYDFCKAPLATKYLFKDNVTVNRIDNTKFLGVVINFSLNWVDYIKLFAIR